MPAQPPCLDCSLRPLCVGECSDEQVLQRLNFVQRRRAPLAAGDQLAWEGDQFRSVYVVRAGALKSMSFDQDGNERVRGFHLPGELVGLDALHGGTHLGSVESLAESEVCELPFSRLDLAMDAVPPLRRHVMGLLSRQLATSLSQGGDFTAEQRIAAFLLDMAQRQTPRSSSGRVQLDMSRRDIANYLRLVTETVSRVLTRLRGAGIIAVNRREIRLLDFRALQEIAGSLAPHDHAPLQQREAA